MPDRPCPHRGAIISYFARPSAMDGDVRRAVVTGPCLPDPLTGARWVPVLRPDGRTDLVDPRLVVDVLPAVPPTEWPY